VGRNLSAQINRHSFLTHQLSVQCPPTTVSSSRNDQGRLGQFGHLLDDLAFCVARIGGDGSVGSQRKLPAKFATQHNAVRPTSVSRP
jgi:hypothetical protein